MKRFVPGTVLALALVAMPVWAAIPKIISYQGVVTDNAGNLIGAGTHSFAFSIYNDPSLGSPGVLGPNTLWTETQTLTVALGGFSTQFPSPATLVSNPLALAFNTQYYLGVSIDGGAEMTPRTPITASPYSLRASVAEALAAPITGSQVLDGGLGSVDVATTFNWANSAATVTIGTTATNYTGEAVTINAPAPGYVVVDADFWLLMNHTNGIRDEVQVGIATSPTAYPDQAGLWVEEVAESRATFLGVPLSGHVQYVFPVGAGSQTYYLNGNMSSGQDALDHFWYANMSAIYYYNASPHSALALGEPAMREKMSEWQRLLGQAKSPSDSKAR